MTRIEKAALVGAGVLIGALAMKAFEASPVQAQSAGVATVSASADGSRAWVGLSGGQVAVCEYHTGGYSDYISCVRS